MDDNPLLRDLGRVLVIAGVLLVAVGAVVWIAGRLSGAGWLPGDFVFRRGRITIFVPLATSILISLVLTLLLNLFLRR